MKIIRLINSDYSAYFDAAPTWKNPDFVRIGGKA